MLNIIEKCITLKGQSMIDGEQAEFYNAEINSKNPSNVSFGCAQTNKELAKANRIQCRQDRADFEDTVYALQDELNAEKAAEENAAEA